MVAHLRLSGLSSKILWLMFLAQEDILITIGSRGSIERRKVELFLGENCGSIYH